ncbi:hypothetical protein ACMXYV_08285 [Neptuniibacter sp. SY11_33]|uniref:hypothetical protein n=1 Tax=Neptuniibacter sp. SY11_33 TaxID=3398215 RepID=UPI0039F49860
MHFAKFASVALVSLYLAGCTGANTKGISATFIHDGAIRYKEVQADTHNFEIHMYENKVGALDAFGINTTTPEEREWVAKDTFSFIPTFPPKGGVYPVCKSPIKVVSEKSYQVTGHYKEYLNRKWWVLYVQCDEVNPNHLKG